MKRILSLLLVLGLVFTLAAIPAAADEPLSMLPAVNDYAAANYTDVPADSWYAQAAQVCYETGLMTGTDKGFEPEKALTVAEVVTIAARLREAVTGDAIDHIEGEGRAWYQDHQDYLNEVVNQATTSYYGIINWGSPAEAATRTDFVALLLLALSQSPNGAFPTSYLPAINSIAALPDSDDSVVLGFYNAGVLTGKDAYGTFDSQGTLSRAECAAMVARVVRPDLRKHFSLESQPAQPEPQVPVQPQPSQAPLSYEEEFLQTEALRVNGHAIPFETYLEALNTIIFRTDFGMAAAGNGRLDWTAQYQGVEDLGEYFKSLATNQVVQDYVIASQAVRLGCAVEDLPKVLTPDPSAALDKVYYAKHILVEDQDTANAILQQLMAAPSLELFDQLMRQYTTDPGLQSSPNGYLYTAGTMIDEFEAAVNALPYGSCYQTPVPSQFGYHIILRLDPKTYPDWESSVQSMLYEDYVEDWMNSATVTPNNVELAKLDVQGRYQQYLEQMGMSGEVEVAQ